MTTAINELKNEEEIFKKAFDVLSENAETEEDFLNLNSILARYTNYVPLFTTNRGACNMTFQINEMFKKHGIENWKTYTDAETMATELIKDQLAIHQNAKYIIEVTNELAKNRFDSMVSENSSTKEIVLEMFRLTDVAHEAIVSKVNAIEDLAELYATISIVRAFQDLQEYRGFTVNTKKLRGAFLDLRIDENGKQYINYDLMIKRGTPATRHFVKVKSYKGKITTS